MISRLPGIEVSECNGGGHLVSCLLLSCRLGGIPHRRLKNTPLSHLHLSVSQSSQPCPPAERFVHPKVLSLDCVCYLSCLVDMYPDSGAACLENALGRPSNGYPHTRRAVARRLFLIGQSKNKTPVFVCGRVCRVTACDTLIRHHHHAVPDAAGARHIVCSCICEVCVCVCLSLQILRRSTDQDDLGGGMQDQAYP